MENNLVSIKMTRVEAIKTYFVMDSKTAMANIKGMSPEMKEWFGDECLKAIGAELKAPTGG